MFLTNSDFVQNKNFSENGTVLRKNPKKIEREASLKNSSYGKKPPKLKNQKAIGLVHLYFFTEALYSKKGNNMKLK